MSLYKDASLVMIPSAYKDGRLYSIRPIPEYGPELVTNGTFDTDTDWIKASGSTISGGSLNIVAAPYNSNTRQSLSLTNGTTYEIVINAIAAGSATDNTFQLGFADSAGNPSNTTQHEFAVGTSVKKLIATASATDSAIIFRSRDAGTSNLSITNVSVKEVLVADGDFTFSRGSNLAATRVDVNGLIEKGRENLILQSNQFDTTWSSIGASVTSGQSGYDGSNDAWLFQALTTTGASIRQSVSKSGVQSHSVYAKAGTANYLAFYNIAGSIPRAWFNLSNGSVETTLHNIDAKIESVGNGWYRCSLVYDQVVSEVRMYVAASNNTFATTTGDNIYIQDAQLEQGLVATDYIETGTSAAQSGILEDMPRLDYSASCPSLLLEPSRTNLVTLSEYPEGYAAAFRGSFNTNAAISPQGVQNASLFTEDTTSNNTHFYAVTSLNWVAGTTYTISVYAKSNGRSIVLTQGNQNVINFTTYFNLTTGEVGNSNASNASIENVGNGWYRCSVTQTALTTGGTNILIPAWDEEEWNYIYTGNGVSGFYSYGHQLETGSYPTSYIPTYGTSQTRSKEQCNLNSVSGEIGQTQGTIFLDADLYKKTNTEFYIAISDGTLSNSIYLHQSSQSIRVNKRIAGVTEFLQVTSANWSSGRNKCAITYTATEMKIFVNGVLKDTEVINGLPSGLSKLTLGSRQDDLGELASDADYKQALLFPTALTDSECIALTTL
jgi:hypothetical protein